MDSSSEDDMIMLLGYNIIYGNEENEDTGNMISSNGDESKAPSINLL